MRISRSDECPSKLEKASLRLLLREMPPLDAFGLQPLCVSSQMLQGCHDSFRVELFGQVIRPEIGLPPSFTTGPHNHWQFLDGATRHEPTHDFRRVHFRDVRFVPFELNDLESCHATS